MLSSVKNFFLTFILALLVFSAAAYLAVNLVIANINGSLDNKDNPSGETSETQPDSGGSHKPPAFEIGDGGESLNVLIVGCDYRSGVFADYDEDVLFKRLGIEKPERDLMPPPNDLALPAGAGGILSDRLVENSDGIRIPGDKLAFIGGFYGVSYRKPETDTVILLRFDKERSHISYTVFDTDAFVVVNGSYCRLSEIFADYGLEALRDKIHSMTGIIIDRTAMLTCESFPAVIDALGGVNFYVPCDMKYDDYSGNVHIDMKSGRQQLNGQKALQVLMYNSYSDGINSRQRTTMNFVQSFISNLTVITNYLRMGDLIKAVDGMIDTDLTTEDLKNSVDMLFKCAKTTVEISAVTTPGNVPGKTDVRIYDENATINAFAGYKRKF
ncbi:MAG: LCP family protein [Clostridia bacterium]|nr:LCP family protein [Clostridia bacterium]